ncbi:MAG: potassium channel family protein, partial [Haloarculaceae archaeon]
VVGAAEKISDAAGDIAKVVLEDIGVPSALHASLPEAVETLARAEVRADAEYAGRTLADSNLETETGVRIVAIRRGSEWLLNPDRDTTVEAGDVCICRGPEDGVAAVYEELTGETLDRPEPPDGAIEDLDRAVEAVVMLKNMSELAVDLAYGSVLLDSPTLAEEVDALEVEVDALQSRFEAWALRAAADVDDPVSIRGLLHIAASTEVVSDAALEISEGVLRGLGSHPVVQAAVEEADETIVSVPVAPDSDLAGRTLGDVELRTTTGMHVVAIRRASDDAANEMGWVLSPGPETTLRPGDHLIAKGTRAGVDRLEDLAS